MTDGVEFIVLLALVVFAAGILIWEEPPARPRRVRAIDTHPVTPIAAIKDRDRVRITGRAAARADLLVSPVGRHSCIGFHLVVEKLEVGVGSPWVAVTATEDFGSFSLSDDTGEAALEGPFDVELEPDESAWETMPVWVYVLLKEQGVTLTEPFGGNVIFRYAETVLSAGDRITALGRAVIEVDPAGRSAGLRDPPMLPHLKGSEMEPVVIADERGPRGRRRDARRAT